jgi:glyoxylase-like metal-dependent hydrolase (beta-lactamase superfamily II)
MVIDPAGDAAKILSNIHDLDLTIGLIVTTHTHPDHIAAIGHIVEHTGASFAVHTAEAENMRRYDFSQFTAYDPTFKQPPLPDRLLKDGDFLVVGDLKFKVLYTPGHSAGGICLAGYGVVFSGDTLFNMGIGRTDGPGGDYNLLISSIRAKLLVLPEQTVVLPGHGPKTTIGQERHSNPFLK